MAATHYFVTKCHPFQSAPYYQAYIMGGDAPIKAHWDRNILDMVEWLEYGEKPVITFDDESRVDYFNALPLKG